MARDRMEEQLKKYKFKLVAQVSQNDRFPFYMGIPVGLRLEWGS
ncbi:uncharacterized protein G2W53_001367 [Senna tora]|uniref:Uncharacterized protein n=1 Tax=Senna tora TaxID=362788 RepID=A0A834XHT3_9FABA|nr:uncharacterized protein G2W53_001367 [Senna tora]